MAENYQNVEHTFSVAKVSKQRKTVEFISLTEFNGLFNARENMEAGAMKNAKLANMIVTYMNNLYLEAGLDFYCYLVRNVENSTHVISDIPEEYQTIVTQYFQTEEPTTETPVEDEPTTDAPDQA